MKTRLLRVLLIGIMGMSVVAMTGCSVNLPWTQEEPDDENDDDDRDEKKSSKKEEDDDEEEDGIGSLKPEALDYFGTTYADYLSDDGDEAELLHADRFVATCTDLDADVVFLGVWNDDAGYEIDDSSEFYRLEGKVDAFFTGSIEKMTVDEFLDNLKDSYNVTSEYRESGGTAYYVSDEEYLHIELTDKNDESPVAVLELSCKDGEKISVKTDCWLIEVKEGGLSFSDIPSSFVFSSGAGGWSTDIEIHEDGSFVGQYHDSDMGDTGQGYAYGTVYICNFSGQFSEPEPTDDPYIYSMKLAELSIDDDESVNSVEIIDEVRYIYATPYGFENASDMLLYLPGASLSDMTDACRSWIFVSDYIFSELPESYYVLYNVGGEEAFTAQTPGSIWNTEFTLENGDAHVDFRPSYYMGSYMSFFDGDGYPSALSLDVPWDGKSTATMECEKSWDDDGTKFNVTVEPVDDPGNAKRKVVITVESITDPDFDFSPWGSSEPGRFSAELIEELPEGEVDDY